jgi:hypothetical protein
MATKKEESVRTTRVDLAPIAVQEVAILIRNLPGSPLLQHRMSEKARLELLNRQKSKGKDAKGGKSKEREARDPEGEFTAAAHTLGEGRYGIPVTAIKGAMVSAAHKDRGIEKTVIRGNMFVATDGRDPRCGTELIEIFAPGGKPIKPVMDERIVRLAQGQPDLRWRPLFYDWEATLRITYVADVLNVATIVSLIQRAGFTVGIGELRPEKCGGYGRFAPVMDTGA